MLYYAYWGLINDFWAYFIDWSHMYSINNFAGSIAWFFGLALQITSIQWVRRNFFEASPAELYGSKLSLAFE